MRPPRPPAARARPLRPPTALSFPFLEGTPRLLRQVLGVSVDSVFSHLAWSNTPRTAGGLGGVQYPLIAGARPPGAKMRRAAARARSC